MIILEKRKHSLSLNSASTTTCSLSSSSDSSTGNSSYNVCNHCAVELNCTFIDPINRKELFNKYKTKMQEVREGGSSTSKSKSLTKAKNVVGVSICCTYIVHIRLTIVMSRISVPACVYNADSSRRNGL